MTTTPHKVAYGFVERLAQDLKDARFELPAFPEAVLRVQRALQAPDTSAGDIVSILGSDPGLAAHVLRIANSAAFRPVAGEVTDLRNAVSRLGFNMVRTVTVEFAMRQLRLGAGRSAAVRAEIEAIWRESLDVASICFVIAKHYAKVNADQALLTGLLHALGRLYVVMRAEDRTDVTTAEVREIADGWQAVIGKAILESWGLPESLQHAVEFQDDVDGERTPAGEIGERAAGAASLTDILIAAKILNAGERLAEADSLPAIRWLNSGERAPTAVLEEHQDEIQSLRRSLAG